MKKNAEQENYLDSDFQLEEVSLDNINELEPAVVPTFGIWCWCGGWNLGMGCGQ